MKKYEYDDFIRKQSIHDKKRIEELEVRVAELIKERDEYDSRRKDAMSKVEEWRTKCWELEKKLKEVEPYLITDAIRRGDFKIVDLKDTNSSSRED